MSLALRIILILLELAAIRSLVTFKKNVHGLFSSILVRQTDSFEVELIDYPSLYPGEECVFLAAGKR